MSEESLDWIKINRNITLRLIDEYKTNNNANISLAVNNINKVICERLANCSEVEFNNREIIMKYKTLYHYELFNDILLKINKMYPLGIIKIISCSNENDLYLYLLEIKF